MQILASFIGSGSLVSNKLTTFTTISYFMRLKQENKLQIIDGFYLHILRLFVKIFVCVFIVYKLHLSQLYYHKKKPGVGKMSL